MTAREALRLGTRGGAAVLRRDDIGSLEPGKCADLAVWRTDGLELGGADDPVAGLVLSGAAPGRQARRRRRRRRARRRARARRREPRSLALTASRREDSLRERSRSPRTCSTRPPDSPAQASASSSARGAQVVAAGETDARRPDRASLRPDLEPGRCRARLPSTVAVLPPVELEIELEEGHYHVPLLVSPYGCASYRGS